MWFKMIIGLISSNDSVKKEVIDFFIDNKFEYYSLGEDSKGNLHKSSKSDIMDNSNKSNHNNNSNNLSNSDNSSNSDIMDNSNKSNYNNNSNNSSNTNKSSKSDISSNSSNINSNDKSSKSDNDGDMNKRNRIDNIVKDKYKDDALARITFFKIRDKYPDFFNKKIIIDGFSNLKEIEFFSKINSFFLVNVDVDYSAENQGNQSDSIDSERFRVFNYVEENNNDSNNKNNDNNNENINENIDKDNDDNDSKKKSENNDKNYSKNNSISDLKLFDFKLLFFFNNDSDSSEIDEIAQNKRKGIIRDGAYKLYSELRRIYSKRTRLDWDDYFLKLTMLVAERSTCIRRHVGAVAVKDRQVLSTGYNGAPTKTKDCLTLGCLRDELKIKSGEHQEICRAVHAEQNAIIQAANHGVKLDGATLYCTHSPCFICAKMIVNAKFKRVVVMENYPDKNSLKLFKEAHIKYEVKDKPSPFIHTWF